MTLISGSCQLYCAIQKDSHQNNKKLSKTFSTYTVQFTRSVLSDSLWPHDLSTPGLPFHHQFLESTQTYVHWVGDAIQPSRPLLSPSPPALNLSQNQGLYQWVNSSHQVVKVLELQLQHQSYFGINNSCFSLLWYKFWQIIWCLI